MYTCSVLKIAKRSITQNCSLIYAENYSLIYVGRMFTRMYVKCMYTIHYTVVYNFIYIMYTVYLSVQGWEILALALTYSSRCSLPMSRRVEFASALREEKRLNGIASDEYCNYERREEWYGMKWNGMERKRRKRINKKYKSQRCDKRSEVRERSALSRELVNCGHSSRAPANHPTNSMYNMCQV